MQLNRVLTDPEEIETAQDRALDLCRECADILAVLPLPVLRETQNACANVLMETFKAAYLKTH